MIDETEIETTSLRGATPSYRAVCKGGRCWAGEWHWHIDPLQAEAAALAEGGDHWIERHGDVEVDDVDDRQLVDAAVVEFLPSPVPARRRVRRLGAMPAGAGGVRCLDCGARAAADGTGRPIVLRHADGCAWRGAEASK